MKNLTDIRPSDYDYALLSQHVYEGETLKPGRSTVPADSTWRVLEVYPGDGGYFGVLYVNDVKRQLVLAHRGTNSIRALIEDLVGVYKGQWDSLQKLAAYEVTRKSIEFRNAHYSDYHLSFTGHSLGGYLAELGVFFCHRSLDYPEANAVSFESPGIGTIAERLQSQHNPIQLQKLDIVGYVTYPDLINTCDRHIGTLYQISTELKPRAEYPLFYTLEAHSKNNIALLLQNPTSVQKLAMDWPVGQQYKLFFDHARFQDGYYVLNPDSEDFKQASLNEYNRIYAAHYKTAKRVGHHFLSLRHFSPELRNVLKALQAVKLNTSKDILTARWTKIGIDTNLQKQLLQYELEETSNGDTLIVLPAGYNANKFRENLAIASKKVTGGYCALLPQNEKNEADEVNGYVNAVITAIGKGVEIEESAEVSPKARLLHVSVPRGMTETEMQSVSNLMKESMAALRETVRDLKITAIDENVKIHAGAKVNAKAIAVSIEVRDRKEQKPETLKPISNPSEFSTQPSEKMSPPNSEINDDSKKLSLAVQGIGSNSTVHVDGPMNLKITGQKYIIKQQPFQLKTPQQLKSWPLQLPQNNPDFIERKERTNALEQALVSSSQLRNILVLHGLGGTGKTQLALHHLHNTNSSYSFRGWLIAKDKNTLLANYRTLAIEAGLLQKDEESEKIIIGRVLRWFNDNPGWLLVFDNAPDYQTIASFLPENGGNVIITSRSALWQGICSTLTSISVEDMTEAESIGLVEKMSGCKESIEDIKKLLETMGHLPLALAQAAAYLQQQKQLTHYTIKDYIREYNKERKLLLAQNSLGTTNVDLHSVAITLSMNMKTLCEEEPLTEVLLQYCAYFDSKNISQSLLKVCLQNIITKKTAKELNDIEFRSILNRTQKYSLLTFDCEMSSISIHELVQTVIQDQSSETMQKDIILALIAAISQEYPEKNPDIEDMRRRIKLIPHMQSILQHSEKIFSNSDKVERDNTQLPLLLNLADVYSDLGDASTQKVLLERALAILEAHYGKEHWQITTALVNLANAHGNLDDALTQKILLERALAIQEAHYDEEHRRHWAEERETKERRNLALDHAHAAIRLLEKGLYTLRETHSGKNFESEMNRNLEVLAIALNNYFNMSTRETFKEYDEKYYGKKPISVAKTLRDLANAHIALGNARIARDLLERASPILEDHYGKEHWEVATTLVNLANVHNALDDTPTAKGLLKRALAIQEAHYGTQHPRVANTISKLLDIFKKDLVAIEDNLENCHPGFFDWIFGHTKAEKSLQTTPQEKSLNVSNDPNNDKQRRSYSTLSIEPRDTFYYRYSDKKTSDGTTVFNKSSTQIHEGHLISPISSVSSWRNTTHGNKGNFNLPQTQSGFFSRRALPPIVPAKLPNLAGTGRVGLLGATMGIAFYSGWQMMQQHKQSNLPSGTESVAPINPKMKH